MQVIFGGESGWWGYGAKARKELERETEVKWDIFTARCMDTKT
jgi:hypothetical protein